LNENARGRFTLFLGLKPWETQLPWAPNSLLEKHVPRPAGDDLAGGFAFARAAAGITSQIVGTNAIAKTRSACACYVAGRRNVAKPIAAGRRQ
jgi:hypothetical protein